MHLTTAPSLASRTQPAITGTLADANLYIGDVAASIGRRIDLMDHVADSGGKSKIRIGLLESNASAQSSDKKSIVPDSVRHACPSSFFAMSNASAHPIPMQKLNCVCQIRS